MKRKTMKKIATQKNLNSLYDCRGATPHWAVAWDDVNPGWLGIDEARDYEEAVPGELWWIPRNYQWDSNGSIFVESEGKLFGVNKISGEATSENAMATCVLAGYVGLLNGEKIPSELCGSKKVNANANVSA